MPFIPDEGVKLFRLAGGWPAGIGRDPRGGKRQRGHRYGGDGQWGHDPANFFPPLENHGGKKGRST